MMRHNQAWKIVLTLALGIFLIAGAATVAFSADEGSDNSRWFNHDPSSFKTVDHSNWSKILTATVHVAGSTKWGGARINRASDTGSRIKGKHGGTERMKINRIPYVLLRDLHRLAVDRYLKDVQRVAISKLDRDEQLAFWLNLHNAYVYKIVAGEFPIRKMTGFRLGTKKTPSVWSARNLEIEGVKLSLDDIREHILFTVWDDPLVLYGLTDGTIGSPDILNRAFTGENVVELLNANAEAFINSGRGVKRVRKNKAMVSRVYEWGQELFSGEEAVIEHLKEFAKPNLRDKLANVQGISDYFYDWKVNNLNKTDSKFLDKMNVIGIYDGGFMNSSPTGG